MLGLFAPFGCQVVTPSTGRLVKLVFAEHVKPPAKARFLCPAERLKT